MNSNPVICIATLTQLTNNYDMVQKALENPDKYIIEDNGCPIVRTTPWSMKSIMEFLKKRNNHISIYENEEGKTYSVRQENGVPQNTNTNNTKIMDDCIAELKKLGVNWLCYDENGEFHFYSGSMKPAFINRKWVFMSSSLHSKPDAKIFGDCTSFGLKKDNYNTSLINVSEYIITKKDSKTEFKNIQNGQNIVENKLNNLLKKWYRRSFSPKMTGDLFPVHFIVTKDGEIYNIDSDFTNGSVGVLNNIGTIVVDKLKANPMYASLFTTYNERLKSSVYMYTPDSESLNDKYYEEYGDNKLVYCYDEKISLLCKKRVFKIIMFQNNSGNVTVDIIHNFNTDVIKYTVSGYSLNGYVDVFTVPYKSIIIVGDDIVTPKNFLEFLKNSNVDKYTFDYEPLVNENSVLDNNGNIVGYLNTYAFTIPCAKNRNPDDCEEDRNYLIQCTTNHEKRKFYNYDRHECEVLNIVTDPLGYTNVVIWDTITLSLSIVPIFNLTEYWPEMKKYINGVDKDYTITYPEYVDRMYYAVVGTGKIQ